MSEKYKIGESSIAHFVTFTIVDWVNLFTRTTYKDIIIDSLNYCINHNGLNVHTYVIMTSHIHLVVSSNDIEFNPNLTNPNPDNFTPKKPRTLS